jgi:hypothetical protein
MCRIEVTSTLDASYRADLEKLLFFNSNQQKVRSDVLSVIERYGVPRIKEADGRLRVTLGPSTEPQTLYVLDPSAAPRALIGVLVYTREGDTLSLLHTAVREDHTYRAAQGAEPLLVRMVAQLREVARRVKGVSSVTLFPGTPKARRLRVS